MYQVEKLEKDDYHKGFLKLLNQLTKTDPEFITFEMFCERFEEIMKNNKEVYVVRDKEKKNVIGTASIIFEKKFSRGCTGEVAHIEDVVIDKNYRNSGLGKLLLDHCKKICSGKAYKIILNCSEENKKFYEKCGFELKSLEMAIYYE